MVVISDKILRIVAPSGRPATTAALYKLNLQEKALERQISELKSSSGTGGADVQEEIRKLETKLSEIQKKKEPLKAQLEELREQEDKEAEASAAAREAALRKGENPYAHPLKIDLTSIDRK